MKTKYKYQLSGEIENLKDELARAQETIKNLTQRNNELEKIKDEYSRYMDAIAKI